MLYIPPVCYLIGIYIYKHFVALHNMPIHSHVLNKLVYYVEG